MGGDLRGLLGGLNQLDFVNQGDALLSDSLQVMPRAITGDMMCPTGPVGSTANHGLQCLDGAMQDRQPLAAENSTMRLDDLLDLRHQIDQRLPSNRL